MIDATKEINQAEILAENEALRKEIEKLKQCKRYGLVWEDHPEALDKKNIIPLLAKDDGLSLPVIADRKQNYLIEGDNYHALKALQHTHRSAIDVIYIDPPYNTGNEFVYNDKIVDKDDSFRHSKWLSFMEKRLKLARELMSDDGVIFISIDDNEQAQLKLLCDAVFGESNSIGNLIWQNKSGGGQAKYYYKGHEYLLVYAKNKEQHDGLTASVSQDKRYTKNVTVVDGIKYYINDDFLRKTHGRYEQGTERRLLYEDIKQTKGQDLLDKVDAQLKRGTYILQEHPTITGKHMVCRLENLDTKRKKIYSIYNDSYTKHGNEEIIEMLGAGLFENPKPISYIKYILEIANNNSATVLDFFAGSGTTGHAVMELNKEDGGDRNFILCTNNEVSDDLVRTHFFNEGHIKKNNKTEFNKFIKEHPDAHQAFLESEAYESLGIARAVTRERIKRVIEGYTTPKGKDIEGLPNNLTYLKTKEFDKKEQYGFDRNLLANLAYNSHVLKYPELVYDSFHVDAFTDISEIEVDPERQPVAFINARDRESLADIVDELTARFGNHIIVETLESYFN